MFRYSYNPTIESAYIIRIVGNETSEEMALRCSDSCTSVGQPWKYFDAIDGTSGKIKLPLDYHPILNLIKHTNDGLTVTEIACFLSHFLLWVKCVELDRPIVILEHDAIMIKPYTEHPFFSTISYLGCSEQYDEEIPVMFPMPPHGRLGDNARFILRAHAYAVDPMVAKKLVTRCLDRGIYTAADCVMTPEDFSIIQDGLYAIERRGKTTIVDRDKKNNEMTLHSNRVMYG